MTDETRTRDRERAEEDGGARTRIHGGLLARNTVINLIGHLIPLAVAVAAMPYVVRGLGTDRFGILAIAWMLLGYFAELGFGRATTKFVAEVLGTGDHDRLARVVWTTGAIQAALGVLAGVALAVATPVLVRSVLEIPEALIGEARAGFLLLAAVLPVALVGSSFRGVLQAAQRFDLTNAVRVPASAANFVLPLLGLAAGLKLPGILALLLASRVAVVGAYYVMSRRLFAVLRGRPVFARSEWRSLFHYGGWATVSSVVSPVLVYLDRFMLGSLVAVSAVAYYTAPYELVTRLWIVPMSLITTLFPAFSTLSGQAEWDRVEALLARAVKYVLFALGPIVILVAAGAGDLLRVWMGDEFARQSTVALQILACGVLVNSLAFVPYSLLQGLGRPDIPAKFHLLELPLQVLLILVLVGMWGIPGAALAWSIRVLLDAALLFTAVGRLSSLSVRRLWTERVPQTAVLFVCLGGLAVGLAGRMPALWERGVVLIVAGVAAGAIVWRYSLGDPDRARLKRLLNVAEAG